ncbi:hypothetical protein [Chryseobacterium gambrini]|uniref:hypothetical protein n=1 Tax=Chryseobacterium gambrini TaxID=373672 RepID=UPI0022F3E8C6|nr:hypothetical protein [Chryseobacterium gambrini]WBX97817.1 hypothetical protein PE065_00865 [Chryseobacterium gambrini]
MAVAQFPKLEEYLTKKIGYKPEEIGIITGATNKNQRISIQNDFNEGKIKVVIGSEAIQEDEPPGKYYRCIYDHVAI